MFAQHSIPKASNGTYVSQEMTTTTCMKLIRYLGPKEHP